MPRDNNARQVAASYWQRWCWFSGSGFLCAAPLSAKSISGFWNGFISFAQKLPLNHFALLVLRRGSSYLRLLLLLLSFGKRRLSAICSPALYLLWHALAAWQPFCSGKRLAKSSI
jgi:hypothetical protein